MGRATSYALGILPAHRDGRVGTEGLVEVAKVLFYACDCRSTVAFLPFNVGRAARLDDSGGA